MNDMMLTVLTLSASGSVLALALLALRPLVKNRVSKAFQYYIWLLVLLRLAVPLSFEGSAMNQLVSAAPAAGTPAVVTVPGDGGGAAAAQENAPPDDGVNTAPQGNAPAEAGAQAPASGGETPSPGPASPPFDFVSALKEYQVFVWLAGAALHFLWFLASYLRFARAIRKTGVPPHPEDAAVFERLRGGARARLACNPNITTPMLIGFFSPRIVLPQLAFASNGMTRELEHILRHELTHCRRRDVAYKWFAVLVASLHWFNPLMLLVRREIGRACELACDEAVIRAMIPAERQGYGETLLSMAELGRHPAGVVATVLCEEKRALKERLLSIKRYQKKTALAAALSLLAAFSLAGCGALLGAATGTSPLPDQSALPSPTPSGPLEQALTLAEQRRYPEAMVLLAKLPDDPAARALLAQLRYVVDGSCIGCGPWTVAAITPDGRLAIADNIANNPDEANARAVLERAAALEGVASIVRADSYATLALSREGRMLAASVYDGYSVEDMLRSEDHGLIEAGRVMQAMAAWGDVVQLDALYPQTAVALTAAGEVWAAYPQGEGFFGKLDWEGVVSVADGRAYALGLKADGTVLCREFYSVWPVDTSGWTDIVAIDAGWCAVGLKADGTVVATASDYVAMDTSGWTDIIAVATSEYCTLGLRRDGTVIAAGDNRYGQLDVSGWTDIVAIDTSAYLSIGLKADGTMVLAGNSSHAVPTPDVSGLRGLPVPAARPAA